MDHETSAAKTITQKTVKLNQTTPSSRTRIGILAIEEVAGRKGSRVKPGMTGVEVVT